MSEESRNVILADVRAALARTPGAPVPPVPGRLPPRAAGSPAEEMSLLLGEISKLGGQTRLLAASDLRAALADLVRAENVRKAVTWQTPDLQQLGVAALLAELGVELVSPLAGKHALAECDLGITSADAALPETGTLLLRSTPDRPRAVSLLPRVHLAIVQPSVLQPDLGPALARVSGEGYWVFVTGPSRTADIELTVTIGVHGPRSLHVWGLEAARDR